jgi:DNA-binding MarR family transcriptional regulator
MKVPGRRDIPYRALADFRYEIRRFLNFSEQAARAAGIEPQQHQALLAIKGLSSNRGATIGILAERLQLRHHSAVELATRMEKKKLIHRFRNQADRRQVLLLLARRGELLLRNLSQSHRAELRSAGPKLVRALRSLVRLDRNSKTSDGPNARMHFMQSSKALKQR